LLLEEGQWKRDRERERRVRKEVVLNAKLLMLRSYESMPKMAQSKLEQFVCA
jgi:hypothetical protein